VPYSDRHLVLRPLIFPPWSLRPPIFFPPATSYLSVNRTSPLHLLSRDAVFSFPPSHLPLFLLLLFRLPNQDAPPPSSVSCFFIALFAPPKRGNPFPAIFLLCRGVVFRLHLSSDRCFASLSSLLFGNPRAFPFPEPAPLVRLTTLSISGSALPSDIPLPAQTFDPLCSFVGFPPRGALFTIAFGGRLPFLSSTFSHMPKFFVT